MQLLLYSTIFHTNMTRQIAQLIAMDGNDILIHPNSTPHVLAALYQQQQQQWFRQSFTYEVRSALHEVMLLVLSDMFYVCR